ncbi:MAG: ABC transporter substrate-binding protein [bacterium]
MSRPKKFFWVVVALFLALGLVWATGYEEAGAQEKLPPVKLIWYYPGTYPQPDQDLVFAEANKIIKEKINATVEFRTVSWGDYTDKIGVIIASGEPYDLCFTANWMNNYHRNVAKGAFLPLDDLLDKYAPKLKASVPEKIWAATKVKGKIYGIINYQISAMTNGLWFRKDLVEKYGFDVKSVKRLEDVEPFLRTIKEKEPGMIPISNANTPGTNVGYVLVYLGFDEIGGRAIPGVVRLNDPSMRVINQFATPEFKNWLHLMRDWYQKGYIRKDAIAIKDVNPDLSAGKIAVGWEGNHKPGGDAEAKARWGYEVISTPISDSILLTSSIIATMHAISVTSKNPERAMMLMELMNTDKELYNLITFGIEGKHYRKVGPNRIEPIKDSKYNPGTPWMHASTFNAYLLPGQPDDVWEKTKELNMSAKASPIIGFAFDPEPVQSEIAQCQSVVKEFLPQLELGVVDPDVELPKFLDKLEKAGASKIIAEMQRQIDEWKKTK